MDEKTNSNEENVPDPSENMEEDLGEAIEHDIDHELDIEAALASVSSLSDALAEHEAEEEAELARLEAEADALAQAQDAIRAEEERIAAYVLPRPPILRLERGQLVSVIPALLLIIIGSWWAFSLSTDSSPAVGIMVLIGVGTLGILWCVHWLSSGRWARGSLVIGLMSLMTVVVLLGLSQSSELGASGWTLLIVAAGFVIVIGRLVSPAVSDRQILLGLLLLVAGLVGVAVTTEMIDKAILDLVTLVAPIIGIIYLLAAVIPKIARRRS